MQTRKTGASTCNNLSMSSCPTTYLPGWLAIFCLSIYLTIYLPDRPRLSVCLFVCV